MANFSETGYCVVSETLRQRIREPAPGRIQLLVGPRQVGKTTLLLELAHEFGDAAYYVPADDPEAAVPGWWDIQWQHVNRIAKNGFAVMLLDEIQYLPEWSRLLKVQIDRIYRARLPIQVVVSGSAALRLGSGARESMAGRFERVELKHWPACDLAARCGLPREKAIETVVRMGSFPGAIPFIDEYQRWRLYILDSIIDPAIGRDLVALEAIRKPALLRQVYAISVGHAGEIVSLTKLAGALLEGGDTKTVAHYLALLQEAFLVASLGKFARNEIRRRAAPLKLLPLSNAFLAASSTLQTYQPETDPARWGRWVENACLAFAVNCRQQVSYWREEPLEVDAVLDGTWGQWAIEIKTGHFSVRQEMRGLFEFCRRDPEYRPLVLCDEDEVTAVRQTGLDCLPWREFLWSGVSSLT